MHGTFSIDPRWGLTALRIVTAIVFIDAGWRKWQAGLAGLGPMFAKMGIPWSQAAGPFIATLELVGGVLLLAGLGVRWLGLLYTIEFIVATFYVKLPTGYYNARLDTMLLGAAIVLFIQGAGRLSIDGAWLERERPAEPRAVTAASRQGV
jgi:putative oxidoreductase